MPSRTSNHPTTPLEWVVFILIIIVGFLGILAVSAGLRALQLAMWAVVVCLLAWVFPGIWLSLATAVGYPALEPWVVGVGIGIVVMVLKTNVSSK